MTELSAKRVQELLLAEKKLNALESAGVDNWDGYGFALESIHREEGVKKLIDDFIDCVQCNLLVEDVEVDYPAGWQAGHSVRLTSDGEDTLHGMLVTFKDELLELMEVEV